MERILPLSKKMERFNLLMSETDAAYHDAALKLGLTDSAMMVLYAVSCGGGECLLCDITCGISKQTVNSALRRLEADGIVCLEIFQGRKKKVRLTEKGERLARDTVLRIIEIENEIFGSWTEEESSLYIELTQRYLTDFREKIKKLS